MKKILQSLIVLNLAAVFAGAQVAPAARGGDNGLPLNTRNLHYALRYSESAQFSSVQPTEQMSTISGSADYGSRSEHNPFTLNYAGGYTWTLSGPDYASGLFQHLMLSQRIEWGRSTVIASDSADYLPESPLTGFSGIPGIGEPIGSPNPAPPTAQTIVVLNTHAVENFASGEFDHSFGYASAISLKGNSSLLRFPDGNGLDANGETGNANYIRRLTARTSLTGGYLYTNYTYPGYSFGFNTNTTLGGVRHQWTRSLATEVSAGPQWISSSNLAAVPSSTTFAANATVTYQHRTTNASAAFSHGTNGGAGYLFGGETTTFTGNLSREFGRNLTIGMSGGYDRTAGLSDSSSKSTVLNSTGATDAAFGGAQVSWQFSRDFILFANYTNVDQSTTSSLPSNALNYMLNITSFGVGYSPRLHRSK